MNGKILNLFYDEPSFEKAWVYCRTHDPRFPSPAKIKNGGRKPRLTVIFVASTVDHSWLELFDSLKVEMLIFSSQFESDQLKKLRWVTNDLKDQLFKSFLSDK